MLRLLRWLACIAAILTIISLGFSTFVQQLLAVGQFPITDHESILQPGNIPQTESFLYYGGNPSEIGQSRSQLWTRTKLSGSVLILAGFSLPLYLKASVYSGMLGDNITAVESSCPTGNCTWPITPSLAVCGGCAPSTYDLNCEGSRCNYTMPSGTVISLINPRNQSLGDGFAVASGTGGRWDSTRNDTLYIANFDVVGARYNSLVQGFDPEKAQASECAMWLCTQAYDVVTVAGHQVQKIAHTFSNIDATPLTSIFDNYTFPGLPREMNPAPGVNYSIQVSAYQSYRSTLLTMFNGTARVNIAASTANSDTADAIWSASADLDPWMQQVALSMSNGLRTWGTQSRSGGEQPDHAQYNGTGYQLGVSVRWAWIILPAVMVLLSIVLLIIVIIQTARSPLAAWKGSPLAYLFFDVEQEVRRSIVGQTNIYHGLRDSVKDVDVVLKGQPGGLWSFKTA